MERKANITGVGLAMGAGFGIAIGAATGNIGVWLPIGIAIGLMYPAMFGSEAKTCGESSEEKQVPRRE